MTGTTDTPRIVGYRCLDYPEGGVIPLTAYTDPCGNDVPVWSDGHEGERDNGSEATR